MRIPIFLDFKDSSGENSVREKETIDYTDVNPVVQNSYRGYHGSLLSRVVWTAQSG